MIRNGLHLASSSERRRNILEALGLRFTWAGEDLDESAQGAESAQDLALRLALAKAQAARNSRSDATVILGADTIVTLDGKPMGKPRSEEHALGMLADLSGRTHEVVTAVAVNSGGEAMAELATTEVRFRRITAAEAKAYWRSGEPLGKAGAYAIQGRGGVFVHSINGSYSGVVGLPVFETAVLLKHVGIDVNEACR
jgi:septum formation protein